MADFEQWPTQTIERAGTVGTVVPAGEAVGFISALETVNGEPLAGDVLRRTCMGIGNEVCKATCQLAVLQGRAPQDALHAETPDLISAAVIDPDRLLEGDPAACSDNNVLRCLEQLDTSPPEALIVSVGAVDKVGFLDDPATRGGIKTNPHGWREVGIFNAFFARNDEMLPSASDERPAGSAESTSDAASIRLLGARLADSGFLIVTMRDADGRAVTGIVHSTRTNMLGKNHRKEYGGEKQSFIQYVLREALEHYEASPDSVTVCMAAAVGPESWKKQYANAGALEQNLPGWAEDDLIENVTNPDWRPGMAVHNAQTGERDELWPQYPQLIRRDIREAATRLGIPEEQLLLSGALDPGQPTGRGMVHSSRNRSRFAPPGAPVNITRDLYAAVIPGSADR